MSNAKPKSGKSKEIRIERKPQYMSNVDRPHWQLLSFYVDPSTKIFRPKTPLYFGRFDCVL